MEPSIQPKFSAFLCLVNMPPVANENGPPSGSLLQTPVIKRPQLIFAYLQYHQMQMRWRSSWVGIFARAAQGGQSLTCLAKIS